MTLLKEEELKEFLDEKVLQYKNISFIQDDPISIPHQFSKKQDQEIAGFFASIIAWGNRKSILKSADKLLKYMDFEPYEFVKNFKSNDLKNLKGSLHRTFMAEDFIYILNQLKRLYSETDSLEEYFLPEKEESNLMPAIYRFRNAMHIEKHRASKHISNPEKGSAAKRLNMFLRWMVRNDEVDLGIWNNIPISKLSIPLDTHTLSVANTLKLIQTQKNNRKTMEELDDKLRSWSPEDPVQYDFALFGLGVYENFKN